jgi:hypothetical protein
MWIRLTTNTIQEVIIATISQPPLRRRCQRLIFRVLGPPGGPIGAIANTVGNLAGAALGTAGNLASSALGAGANLAGSLLGTTVGLAKEAASIPLNVLGSVLNGASNGFASGLSGPPRPVYVQPAPQGYYQPNAYAPPNAYAQPAGYYGRPYKA